MHTTTCDQAEFDQELARYRDAISVSQPHDAKIQEILGQVRQSNTEIRAILRHVSDITARLEQQEEAVGE